MKKFKKILSLALVVVMALAVFAGCKKANPAATENTDPYAEPEKWNTIEEEKKANPDGITLTIAIPTYTYKNKAAWQTKVFDEFVKQYPYVTLNFLETNYGDFDNKVVNEVNSGNSVDIMFIGVNDMPSMALRNLVQPLQGYVNMKNPDMKLSAMDTAFKYGKNYYVAASEINFAVIYYNKDIFAAAGQTDPMALYNAGQWNWNTFSAAGRNLTRYMNQANGVTSGYYGYASEYPYLFLGMNNTSVLKLDSNGKYVLNMDDPALATALENYNKANFEDKWSGWSETSKTPLEAFQEGRAAMYGMWTQFSYENAINGVREEMGMPTINYGVVPLPACQNNPNGTQMVHSAGFAIGKTSKVGAHAGKLIDMLVSADVAQQAEQNKKRPEAHVELYKKMASLPLIAVNVNDSGVEGAYDLLAAVTNPDEPMTVAQAIEKFKPVYQRTIDELNKGGKK